MPDDNREVLLVDYDGINKTSDFSEFKDHQFRNYEKVVKEIEQERSWMFTTDIPTMRSSHASSGSHAINTPGDAGKSELRIRERRKFYEKEEALDRRKKYIAAQGKLMVERKKKLKMEKELLSIEGGSTKMIFPS